MRAGTHECMVDGPCNTLYHSLPFVWARGAVLYSRSSALSRPFGAAFQSLLFSRSAFTLAQLASHTHDRGTAQPVLQLNACAWTSWMTWLKRAFSLAGTILLFITIRNDSLRIRFIHIFALCTVIYLIRFIRPNFALMYIAT